MKLDYYTKLLEGRQTLETISNLTHLKKTSCLNLISRLKKANYLIKTGGGKQKRIYTISQKKLLKSNGMFDILNKYAKKKIIPPFEHTAHSDYKIEDAIADLISLKSVRINVVLLSLFNHIKNWNYLYQSSKQKNVTRNIGLFYDIARLTEKTKRMPNNIYQRFLSSNSYMPYKNSGGDFKDLEKKWRLKVPLKRKDLQ